MTAQEVKNYCLSLENTFLDTPFDFETEVIRHKENSKIFILFCSPDERPSINLKCEPGEAEFLRSVYKDVIPGYHMNKTHWNTVYLDGSSHLAPEAMKRCFEQEKTQSNSNESEKCDNVFDRRKSKFVKLPALDINGNSNFNYDYGVGFSTKYFLDLKENMDDISWRAIYMQEPIEREGILYSEDELQYFFDLPKEKPDTVIAVCDSKGQGKDYVCCPCGYVYGDKIYINEVVFNNGLPEITKPMVANLCVKNKVSRMDIESNNGGDYYAKDVDKQIKKQGGNTSIRTFFTSSNKITKIVTESDFVKKNFIFLHKSKQNTEYKRFMQNLLSFTITGKAKHDDAPDAIAMLSQLFKELSALAIKIIDRKSLPF